jgi:predicted TPR repeat methyltransferase
MAPERKGVQMAASEAAKRSSISISMPAGDGRDQDAEWCWVTVDNGARKRIRFHDYADIYAIPGLYERLFHDELKCRSPETVCGLLGEALEQNDRDPSELRVFDLGAGSGMVAEQLQQLGAGHFVGLDITEAAREAAERDRPDVYDAYLVADMCAPGPDADEALREADLNCLTSVAALGFGDIPPLAFANAVNYIATGGLVAFTLRDRFLENSDKSGYARLIERMLNETVLRTLGRRRYRHRFSNSGKPLHYVAVVAEKTADVPLEWV